MGDHRGRAADGSTIRQNFGPFLALTQFIEQANIYNTFNTSLDCYIAPNSTINGIGLNALWCPSDGQIASLRYPARPGDGWDDSPIPMTYASYAGNLGPLVYYTNSVGAVEHHGPDEWGLRVHRRLLQRRPAERLAHPPGRHHRRDQQHLPLRRARPHPDLRHRRCRRPLRRQLVDLGRLRRHHRIELLPAQLLPVQ